DHLDAVVVEEADAPPRPLVLRRDDGDGAGLVHPETPLRDVEVVGAEVGEPAPRILAIGPPRGEMLVYPTRAEARVVGPPGGRAEPAVPVQARLHRLLIQVAPPARLADADVDDLDLADPPAAHVLARLAELAVVLRALLAAGLED